MELGLMEVFIENLRNIIQEFHEIFDDLIRETNQEKIVVFIDELDRCTQLPRKDVLENWRAGTRKRTLDQRGEQLR